MTTDWREMDQATLDAAYNNRAAVADAERYFVEWPERSAEIRAQREHRAGIRFGPGAAETLDLFPAPNPNAPLLLFVHGGYWRALDKDDFSFLVEGPMAHGFSVGLVNYTLAPTASVTGIVEEIRRAVDWIATREAPGRALYLAGHSAGGHLVAMAAGHPAVRGTLAISGIFDLEPIRRSWLNADLKLDEAEVAAMSPIRHIPDAAAPLLVTVGAAELPELRRQSAAYWGAWATAGLTGQMAALAGEDHFSIVDDLARPEGVQTRMLAQLAGRM